VLPPVQKETVRPPSEERGDQGLLLIRRETVVAQEEVVSRGPEDLGGRMDRLGIIAIVEGWNESSDNPGPIRCQAAGHQVVDVP
jgi:hypothetical protein